MQKSVEAERIRLDSILRSVGDGVYGVDGQGVITFANPAALGMLDYTEDVFAEQWATQAPMGWWIQDHRGQWFRK